MRSLTLLLFGKLKEPYLRAACAEYEKRLSPYCSLKTVELPPVKLPENPTQAQVAQALAREAQLVLPKIPRQASVAALCVEGRHMRSEQFAAWLAEQPNDLAFLIGSSHGLDESLKACAGLRLSLSAMTLPHQLARVLLLEQIYRGFQIGAGGKYHK